MTFRKLAGFMLIVISLASVHRRMTAQTAVDGAIGGNVKDRTGAFVSGAAVTINNNGTNAEQTATSDTSGSFRVIHLQPGAYTVTIAAPGFETFKSEHINVSVGSLTDMQPTLALGASTEMIDISSEAPSINTINNDFTTTIGLKDLQD